MVQLIKCIACRNDDHDKCINKEPKRKLPKDDRGIRFGGQMCTCHHVKVLEKR